VALERTEIVLPARGRFDLRATVRSRGPQGLPPYRWRDGATPLLERAEQLPDGSVHLLAIRPDRRGVVLRVTGRDAREIEVLAPLAARVRRALALDFDPAPFQRACATDPLLHPVARLGLGRVLHGTSAFEDVVGALACGGAASTEGTGALARLAALGPRCPARPSLRAFPAAGAVARIDPRRLRERTGLGQLAAGIRTLARESARGRRDLRAIDHLSTTAAARALAGVRGLGPVGVARVLLLLGHHDRPVLEPEARTFARSRLGHDRARFDRWLRRHRPWRGLALWFALWLETPDAAEFRTLPSRALPGRRAADS
jgi:3-methyladenine DNA glycosylase/8-oxoguanine DNA glycosylase